MRPLCRHGVRTQRGAGRAAGRQTHLFTGTSALSTHVCSSRLRQPSETCDRLRRCTQETKLAFSCAPLFQSRVTPSPCRIT